MFKILFLVLDCCFIMFFGIIPECWGTWHSPTFLFFFSSHARTSSPSKKKTPSSSTLFKDLHPRNLTCRYQKWPCLIRVPLPFPAGPSFWGPKWLPAVRFHHLYQGTGSKRVCWSGSAPEGKPTPTVCHGFKPPVLYRFTTPVFLEIRGVFFGCNLCVAKA